MEARCSRSFENHLSLILNPSIYLHAEFIVLGRFIGGGLDARAAGRLKLLVPCE